jgi:hypothetical protein
MNRNDATLGRLRGMVVDQNDRLADDHNLFQVKQSSVAVQRLGMRLDAELLTRVGSAMHGQGHVESYANRPPAFFASKVKKGHF